MKQDLAAASAVLLAAVFAVAAVAKLRRPAVTRSAVTGFGLPTGLARPLPFAELAVAALLLASPRLGGIAAAALLSAFTLLIVRTMRAGAQVRCGCFGGADDRPVGASTLVRNVALLAAAATAAAGRATMTRPTLAAAITVTTAAAATAMLVALAGLRSDTGALFPSATARRSA